MASIGLTAWRDITRRNIHELTQLGDLRILAVYFRFPVYLQGKTA